MESWHRGTLRPHLGLIRPHIEAPREALVGASVEVSRVTTRAGAVSVGVVALRRDAWWRPKRQIDDEVSRPSHIHDDVDEVSR